MLQCSKSIREESPMNAQSNRGTSALGGAPRYTRETSSWESILNAWAAGIAPIATRPARAALAVTSRCANIAFNQQLQQAYAGAQWARDAAQAVADVADREFPAGPTREILKAALARNVADAEQAMRDVLRKGREHGHLAFAFPVHG
jgi:hypothetical protein